MSKNRMIFKECDECSFWLSFWESKRNKGRVQCMERDKHSLGELFPEERCSIKKDEKVFGLAKLGIVPGYRKSETVNI